MLLAVSVVGAGSSVPSVSICQHDAHSPEGEVSGLINLAAEWIHFTLLGDNITYYKN